MICKKENIIKIICEYKNDIEILFSDNRLTSWQIKSTGRNTVSTKKVYESIQLFNLLGDSDRYSEFILVSNRNFAELNMQLLVPYARDQIPDLKSKVQKKFDGKLLTNHHVRRFRDNMGRTKMVTVIVLMIRSAAETMALQ
jgi:hypothetical protein